MVRFGGAIALLGLVLAPSPALAQIDLSGSWGARYHEDFPERIPGPELANFLGLPITEGARQWALSWDPSRLTLPEHQCQVHVSPYIYRGPLALRIWEDREPRSQKLLAIKNYISTYEQTRTIWMDGRPHPPEYAAHTWEGFSTGKWEGDMLTVETTHIKQGWIRRNGLPESDRATLVEHFIRHGEYLTHVSVVTDPVYLTEPLVKSNGFRLTANGVVDPYPCEWVDEIVREKGVVPNHLPGTNQASEEFAAKHHLSVEGVKGGAATALPEFAKKAAAP